jgi:multiple sugar transport system permease protein
MSTTTTPGVTGARPVKPPDPTAGRRRSPSRSGGFAGYVFLAPWFVGLALFTIGPLIYSLYLSFTDYDLLQSPNWIGFANYRKMFSTDPRFFHSVWVTIRYVVLSVPIKLVLALAVALLLNRRRQGVGLYRSLFYLPSLLGTSVAVALIWRSMFSQSGSVNSVLSAFGITGQDWINSPTWALGTIIVLACWQFGAPMVIFLAGLKQIPAELYDAAAVDGAGRRRQFFAITLPLLSPVIFFNLLLEMINAFQAFTPAYIISGGSGGPADSTLFYTLYLYQKGFSDFQFGYASAMAWVLLLVVGVVTAIMFRLSRTWVFYGDEGER